MGCVLETSIARHYPEALDIADAVSSFPYYPIKKDTKIFITCANKQLGSIPGLTIIGIHKDYGKGLIDDKRPLSYLNLETYRKYRTNYQLPFTAPIANMLHLSAQISVFDRQALYDKISGVSQMLYSYFTDDVVGDKCSPVINIKKTAIPCTIATKYQLYNVNNYKADVYQIFTYSATLQKYENFLNEVRLDN